MTVKETHLRVKLNNLLPQYLVATTRLHSFKREISRIYRGQVLLVANYVAHTGSEVMYMGIVVARQPGEKVMGPPSPAKWASWR